MNNSENAGLPRLPTGVSGLDIILGGGFLVGGVYIIQGTPGTGKTTLANQIAFNHAATGGKALYTTLLAEYHGRMMQHLGNMSFFDTSKIPDQVSYLNGFGTLRESGYQGLRDLLRHEITKHRASVLILDGFATVQRGALEAKDFNEFVHELQGIAIATDCTVFLLSSSMGVKETPEYTIVDGIVELSDQMLGWSSESTLQVVKLRGTSYLRGRHAFRITNDGLVVYPRIEMLLAHPSRSELPATERLSSGVERLDTMLGGGLPTTSTTMVLGPSGVGKTTFGLQFLSKCSADMPGLLFGFYETPARIRAKAVAVCPSLNALFDSGAVEILWQPPTDGLLDAYGARLLDNVRRRGVRRLVIDGLGAFQSAAVDPVRLNQYLTALMNELRAVGVSTVYTMAMPDMTSPNIREPVRDLTVPSDNLILMRYVERDDRLHRTISILKVRNSDFDPTVYEYVTSSQGLLIKGRLGDDTALSGTRQEAVRPSRN
ncbi:MAG: RAD55 family ATPase [Burkholderiaceae bacterium]